MNKIAYLSNKDGYTFFQIGNERFRFVTSPYLENYTKIKEYDNGYIVVDSKLSTLDQPQEDYIDMEYILESLGLDTSILKQITEVIIK